MPVNRNDDERRSARSAADLTTAQAIFRLENDARSNSSSAGEKFPP
jgi:hypothetical protein